MDVLEKDLLVGHDNTIAVLDDCTRKCKNFHFFILNSMFTPKEWKETIALEVKAICEAKEVLSKKTIAFLDSCLETGSQQTSNHVPWRDRHKTKKLYNPWTKEKIDIDEQIVQLVGVLWSRKFRTFNSCQDNVPADYIWIQFDPDSATRFLQHLHSHIQEIDSFVGRVNSVQHPPWLYKLDHDSVGEYLGEPICLNVSIRFHKSDLERVIELLRKD